MSRTIRLALLGGLTAIALAACGGGTTQAPDATPGSSPTDGGTGEAIAVEATEFAFAPSTIATAAGDVTFEVTNAGALEHDFEVYSGDTLVDGVKGIDVGATQAVTVALEAGDYTYVCKIAGHEEAGMTGTLTVTE